MSEPKPFASLGPTLLARKGAARPAMRPQVQPMVNFERQAQQAQHHADQHDDDLGWNDMGNDVGDEAQGAEVLPLTPPPANPEAEAESDAAGLEAEARLTDAAKPAVRRQQEAIARRVATAERKRVSRRSALDEGRRAAFTLRLDAQRHLKLRLACTIRNASAQQVVTEALDKLLAEIPEVESLAAQVKRK